ncbi:hypothetical protein C0995_011839 [Termitomyces sp. Mi166|nr:hypothetical protein C0995_011839 [Termitomyces sp. Mi166\
MANVLQHPIDLRPVSHAPSPFGFGFALASSSSAMVPAAWQPTSTPGHTNPAAFQQLASSVARVQKRRHEAEDDSATGRDASMDRSPTPERPKRAAPKRARVLPQADASSKDDTELKENKAPVGTDDHDVDVGVLLASLPTQSLLPLLTSLLDAQPSLKATILHLIPRPTLETATQALAQSAKKLRDAYPYSSASSFGQPSFSTSFGFGRPSNINTPAHHHGVTNYIISQPALAQSELVRQLFPRLSDEWKAWVLRVDEIVNRSGGMFGSETVQQWGRALDEMADGKVMEGSEVMRRTRDLWVVKAAAARAWARNASTASKFPHRPLVKPPDSAVLQYLQRHKVPSFKRPSPSSHVAYFDPDAVCDSDLRPPLDPAWDLSERPVYWDDPSIVGTTVGSYDLGAEFGIRTARFPLAKNRSSLYQNLLHLLHNRHPAPSLPLLLDYHDLHPGLRSTRSYNLLISMAIRMASYGTVRWLLRSMRADNLPGNLETWKLRVRWLVQSGMWDKAWKETMRVLPQMNTRMKDGAEMLFQVNGALPLHIWMEFFRTLKYGTTRTRSRRRQALASNAQLAPLESTSSPSSDSVSYSIRYHTLMNHRPTVIPHDLSKTPPKVIYHTVWIMLHVGQADKALSLAKSYLECLPRSITTSCYRICLDILHLLIAKWSSQRGLRCLYETRRMMVSLLSIYPTLRPTSTTLYLLLAPLDRAKRCGTVAANTLRAFKSDYGVRTEDRRVRRRVAVLALKEGRMDIVDRMLNAERSARRAQAAWRLLQRVTGAAAKPLPPRLLRPPTRTIFRHNGQEERRWCRFTNRVSCTRRRRHKRMK